VIIVNSLDNTKLYNFSLIEYINYISIKEWHQITVFWHKSEAKLYKLHFCIINLGSNGTSVHRTSDICKAMQNKADWLPVKVLIKL
jgi:hypothetical protein